MALFRISKTTREDGPSAGPFARSDPEDDGKWNWVRYEES
eukprot:gene395-19028_t